MKNKIREFAKKISPKLIEIRRQLHQYPELSFQEFETSKYIAAELTSWGIEFETGMAGTGICAWIKGQNPENRKITLRADIDALPINEANEVAYKSKNEGVMHACGHDAHTSSLLGAAYILNQLREHWSGTIQLIFQPGEELLPGGATKVIAEGWLDRPYPSTCILGQHVEPGMEVGKIGLCSGLFMASADEIYVTVTGKGGHGARPQDCIDTILISSQLIVALQQIVSRRANPIIPSVLTFGKINSSGGATNIIPNEVKILGTFRTFDEQWRIEAHELMQTMAEQLCASMGAHCEFNIIKGYPFLLNNPNITEQLRRDASEYLGAENVIKMAPRMGAEDFAFYSHKMPASFYRLGTKNPNGSGLHSNTFDIDEAALEIGAGLMAWLAVKQLEN